MELVRRRDVEKVGDVAVAQRARDAAWIRHDDVVGGSGIERRHVRRDRVGRRDDHVRRRHTADHYAGAGFEELPPEGDGTAARGGARTRRGRQQDGLSELGRVAEGIRRDGRNALTRRERRGQREVDRDDSGAVGRGLDRADELLALGGHDGERDAARVRVEVDVEGRGRRAAQDRVGDGGRAVVDAGDHGRVLAPVGSDVAVAGIGRMRRIESERDGHGPVVVEAVAAGRDPAGRTRHEQPGRVVGAAAAAVVGDDVAFSRTHAPEDSGRGDHHARIDRDSGAEVAEVRGLGRVGSDEVALEDGERSRRNPRPMLPPMTLPSLAPGPPIWTPVGEVQMMPCRS